MSLGDLAGALHEPGRLAGRDVSARRHDHNPIAYRGYREPSHRALGQMLRGENRWFWQLLCSRWRS